MEKLLETDRIIQLNEYNFMVTDDCILNRRNVIVKSEKFDKELAKMESQIGSLDEWRKGRFIIDFFKKLLNKLDDIHVTVKGFY